MKSWQSALLILALPFALVLAESVAYQRSNSSNRWLESGGIQREYLLYVPPNYDPAQPAPLVLSLHGAGGWPAQQRDLSGWNRLADREGFLVAYPAGYGSPRGFRVSRGKGLVEDVDYIRDLLDHIAADYNIDSRRIYANGLSNGGGMSYVISCTLQDRIAAVGMVAPALTIPWSHFNAKDPVPVITIHGKLDPITPYAGGTTWIMDSPFPAVTTWMELWSQRNGCSPDPKVSAYSDAVNLHRYQGCQENAPVDFYVIEDGGHTWPGGKPLPEWFAGKTSTEIDATQVLWSFFQEHTLSP